MRLTSFSDYALRLLMYAAASGGQLITIEETCQTYNISRGHLMKMANLPRIPKSGTRALRTKPRDFVSISSKPPPRAFVGRDFSVRFGR